MHFFNSILVFVGTTAAVGFTVSKDQPDGVYQVEYAPQGRQIHTTLDPTLLLPAVNSSKAEESESGVTIPQPRTNQVKPARVYGCDNLDLSHDDTDRAVEALKFQCNPGSVNGNRDFYSVQGNTVAYICNYNKGSMVCTSDQLGDTYLAITTLCGQYKSGWAKFQELGYQMGYEERDANFCGRGVDG